MSDSSVSSPDAPPPLRAGYGNAPLWVPLSRCRDPHHLAKAVSFQTGLLSGLMLGRGSTQRTEVPRSSLLR